MQCSPGWALNSLCSLSLFMGLSVLVPYAGTIFMFIPVASIGFFQWDWSSELGWAVSAYLIIQILDGNLLAPLLLSGVVNMHTIALIAAVLLFGQWWGVLGSGLRSAPRHPGPRGNQGLICQTERNG
jgi:putative permease